MNLRSMSLFRELARFFLGLIFIIGGFVVFMSIALVNDMYSSDITRHYLIMAAGFILILIGIVFMYLFVKKDIVKQN
ncbi:MAG: hypothetical protein KKG04_10850 [Candidatus Thermoplasmatota archaeon]|nr:hypothetical protein [Candidatus Thermoplasmatota archaeon]